MACEGNFSPSRRHIIETLVTHGYPVGLGCHAAADVTFVTMLCKPSHASGIGFGRSTIHSGPVHDEDKLVVQRLIGLGEGIAANEALQTLFEEICQKPEVDASVTRSGADWTWQQGALSCIGSRGLSITVLDWPAAPWLLKVTTLNLSRNSLTTLPEALFSSLPNLEHLNLNQNCLWELSPSVGLLKSLKALSLNANCLESLPSDLTMLPQMETIQCSGNPLIEPPKAVCRGGWVAVKSCKVAHLALPTVTRPPLVDHGDHHPRAHQLPCPIIHALQRPTSPL